MNFKERQSPIYLRLFRGFFHKELQTPWKMVAARFFSNKIAVLGLVIFVLLFGSVMVLPFFYPLQKSYQEVTQQNVSPGRNLMSYPKEIEGNVVQIAVGSRFSVAIDPKGKVFLWGKYPASIGAIPQGMGKVIQISAGLNHILALNEEGELFSWGSNRFHQLEVPEEIPRLTADCQLLAGNQYSIVVTEEGVVYAWGNQNLLDFAPKEYQGRIKKVAVNTGVVLGLLDSGEVVSLGRRESRFSDIPQMSEVTDLTLTAQTAYALLADGSLIEWGYQGVRTVQEPLIEEGETLISLASGRYHITALSNLGRVFCYGEDQFGAAKVPENLRTRNCKLVYSGYYQNYALMEDGSIQTWGLEGYLFGTDGYGRDIFTRFLHGGRLTMTIGGVAVLIQTLIGIVIGGIAGYYGGKVDNLLMRFTEIVNSLPFLPFAMILSALLGNRLTQMQRIYMIMVVLGVISWPGMARLVRAQVLTEKSKEFVTAAKVLGVREFVIIFRHILPNILSFVIVSATGSFAASMLTESSLSFLGFGVTEPSPTWGNMLTGSQSSTVIGTYWWRWIFAAAALSLVTISINLIGDGLRGAIDPKQDC